MADLGRMARRGFLTATLAAVFSTAAHAQTGPETNEAAMTRIKVIVGDTTLPATLDDMPAARDFASMLPLELVVSDYHGTEKVADLGRKLDATDAPEGYAPQAGDITQYRPWGNLAIFYKPFSYSRGLVRLGAFDGSIAALIEAGETRIRIEAAD